MTIGLFQKVVFADGLHGLYLAAERWLKARLGNNPLWGTLPAQIILAFVTYFLVNIAWVFFRAPDFASAWRMREHKLDEVVNRMPAWLTGIVWGVMRTLIIITQGESGALIGLIVMIAMMGGWEAYWRSEDEHRRVRAHADKLREEGAEASALLIQGPIIETVLSEAKCFEADLLIVGSHGFGALYDLLVGSSSRGILRDTDIPVLVVPVQDDT